MKTSLKQSLFWRRRILAAGAGLGLALLLTMLLALALLPAITGIAAAAPRTFVDRIPVDSPGAYVLTDGGAMPLYDWYMPMAKLPPDAATLPATSLRSVVMVAAQFHTPETYILYDLRAQKPVDWQAVRRDGRRLFLEPPVLGAGDYLLIVPTDDVLGGNTYHYFRLY